MLQRRRILNCEWTDTEEAVVVKYRGNRFLVTVSVPVVAGIGGVCVALCGQVPMVCPVRYRHQQSSNKEDRQ